MSDMLRFRYRRLRLRHASSTFSMTVTNDDGSYVVTWGYVDCRGRDVVAREVHGRTINHG